MVDPPIPRWPQRVANRGRPGTPPHAPLAATLDGGRRFIAASTDPPTRPCEWSLTLRAMLHPTPSPAQISFGVAQTNQKLWTDVGPKVGRSGRLGRLGALAACSNVGR